MIIKNSIKKVDLFIEPQSQCMLFKNILFVIPGPGPSKPRKDIQCLSLA